MGLFFAFLGGSVLLLSVISAVNLSAPPPTTSSLRHALTSALVALFGVPAGHVLFHLVFGSLGALALWFGIKLRQSS